jgi:pimeloyl-ACP methyl ester carboxylesterase
MRFLSVHEIFFQYDKRKPGWLRNLEMVITLFILVSFIGLIFEFTIERIDKGRYKPKGRLVNVSKHRLLTNLTGEGKATVVFESDINKPIQQWNRLRELVSDSARTFSYERAGYGWSDSAAGMANVDEALKDLRNALKKAGASSPYILVGQGYGGVILSKFAEKYPDEVIGVVLIDSFTEEQITSEVYRKQLRKDLYKARIAKYTSLIGGIRLLNYLNIVQPEKEMYNALDEDSRKLFKIMRIASKQNNAVYEEYQALYDYTYTGKSDGIFGEKPLVVFTSLKKTLASDERDSIIEQQKGLLKLSSKGEQVLVDSEGGYIHLEKPEVIANVIKNILKGY